MTAETARTKLEVGAILYDERTEEGGEIVGALTDCDDTVVQWHVVWDGCPETRYLSTYREKIWEGIQCTSLPSPVDQED